MSTVYDTGVLIAAGVCTGIFIVPIQVAVQALPPANEKGRIIALMNQVNWIGIILGAVIFKASVTLCETWNQPRNTAFAVGAVVMLPIFSSASSYNVFSR